MVKKKTKAKEVTEQGLASGYLLSINWIREQLCCRRKNTLLSTSRAIKAVRYIRRIKDERIFLKLKQYQKQIKERRASFRCRTSLERLINTYYICIDNFIVFLK